MFYVYNIPNGPRSLNDIEIDAVRAKNVKIQNDAFVRFK